MSTAGYVISAIVLALIIWLWFRIGKKKQEPVTLEFLFANEPVPPCGEANKIKHYEWERLIGMSCPTCAAERERAKKDAELDALAEKVADRLIARGVFKRYQE